MFFNSFVEGDCVKRSRAVGRSSAVERGRAVLCRVCRVYRSQARPSAAPPAPRAAHSRPILASALPIPLPRPHQCRQMGIKKPTPVKEWAVLVVLTGRSIGTPLTCGSFVGRKVRLDKRASFISREFGEELVEPAPLNVAKQFNEVALPLLFVVEL